jgi:hypothetical protein
MLAIAEMVVHLALQRGLDHHLGQPAQQPVLTGQPQALGPRPPRQLCNQLLLGHPGHSRVHPATLNPKITHGISSVSLSYTVEITVPSPSEIR